MATTKYVVLWREGGENELYDVLPTRYEAAGSTAAVRAAAAELQKAGEYVAVPERSFEVVKIEIETNPRVKVVK